MIEPIKENQPEFHEESTNPLELVKQDSQIEPLQENVPLTR
jgi:hypothetical protein